MIKNIIYITLMGFFLTSCGNADVEKIVNTDTENPTLILALGDSITAGYNLDIEDSYPAQLENLMKADGYNYKITNAGVSGDTSQNLLDRIELYDGLNPDIYLLTIGGNDGLRRQSVTTMKENISSIIEHLNSVNSDATIVLSGMQMPINYGIKYANDFKKAYPELAETYNLPFFEFFLEGVAREKDLNLSDGIHPNQAGYEIIANNMYDFLEKEDIILK